MARFLPLIPFILVVLVSSGQMALASSVKKVCTKATAGGPHANLDSFCVTTLQAVPASATADAHGLAAIATNLTLTNYTAAVGTIKGLQRRGGWSVSQEAALNTCLHRYLEVLSMLHSAVDALATGNTQAYVAEMGSVRRAATDCDDALKGKINRTPMRKVDENAVKLTTVAMLIVVAL